MLRASLIVVGFAGLFALAACAADGKTPDCIKNNVSCEEFAVCRDGNGNEQDPTTYCCKDLTGGALDECLFGYGVGVTPIGPGGAGGGTGGTGGTG